MHLRAAVVKPGTCIVCGKAPCALAAPKRREFIECERLLDEKTGFYCGNPATYDVSGAAFCAFCTDEAVCNGYAYPQEVSKLADNPQTKVKKP
jgi:hypothetical protein